jgi:hypothetical protein
VVGVEAALWGLFGGFAVEGLELYAALRRDGRWPWKRGVQRKTGAIPEAGPMGYAIAELIRLLIGAGLASAAVTAGQITGPLGALGVGVAAPTIIGQLAKLIPLAISPEMGGNPDFRAATASAPAQANGARGVAAAEPGAAEAAD